MALLSLEKISDVRLGLRTTDYPEGAPLAATHDFSLLIWFVFWQFDSDFVIRLRNILLKTDITLYDPQAATDILEPETDIAFIQFIEVRLYDTSSVVVDTEIELIGMYILGEVDKTGAAVLEYIVDQFLYDTEDDQFFFSFESFLVFMETAAGIDGT